MSSYDLEQLIAHLTMDEERAASMSEDEKYDLLDTYAGSGESLSGNSDMVYELSRFVPEEEDEAY